MARQLVYSGLVAGLLCGCQSASRHSECCDDCVPPKSACPKYCGLSDTLVTKTTALQCAHSDLKELRKTCGKLSGDYTDGFEQAYVDLAMGRPALTPPVPPRKYWTAYYRSCAGDPAVADWFEGYRAGLDWGCRGGVSRFNQIAHSWPPGSSVYPDPNAASLAGTGTEPGPVSDQVMPPPYYPQSPLPYGQMGPPGPPQAPLNHP